MAESRDHISCSQLVELVTDYLEDALPSEQRSLFEEHLNLCEGCVVYVDQLERTVALTGRLREEDVPAEAKARLLAIFSEWGSR
jgi:anti-sigma factor RsiW